MALKDLSRVGPLLDDLEVPYLQTPHKHSPTRGKSKFLRTFAHVVDACFPKYDVPDPQAGARAFWEDYYARVDALVARWPDNIKLFDMATALNDPEGQLAMPDWVGCREEVQRLVAVHKNHSQPRMI